MTYVSKKVERDRELAERTKMILANHNQEYKGKPERKLSYEQILERVPNVVKLKDFWIRTPEEWVAKSFNMSRQIIDFVSWILCDYPVPIFMYKLFVAQAIAHNARRNLNFIKSSLDETFLDWFITIGQGMSFRKACKDFLSNKEAHLFLTAPRSNSIAGNMLWAKCKSFGVSDVVISILCNNWEGRVTTGNKNSWDKIINFYSKYPDIDRTTVQDTMDFLYNAFGRDKNFSLSGRTLNSVIQLSNEWHQEQQVSKGHGFRSWDGLPIPNWKWDVTDEELDVWYITQILDSKQLLHEGRTMKHCVGSYSYHCMEGHTGIFTVEHRYYGNKTKILTAEVNNGFNIVQVRGKCNRYPDKEETKMLKKWAADSSLKYGLY